MSHEKKETIIKVKNLTIFADNVKIIKENDKDDHKDRRRDPWGDFWGRRWRDDDRGDVAGVEFDDDDGRDHDKD